MCEREKECVCVCVIASALIPHPDVITQLVGLLLGQQAKFDLFVGV